MNLAYYVLVFDKATDALLDRLDLGETYRRATDHTTYVLEAHVTYEREVKNGAPLRVTTQLIDADEKRLHLFHAMYHDETGQCLATNELLSIHIDLAGPRAAPFPEPQRTKIEAIMAEHRSLPRPKQLGHVIGIRRC